MFAKGDQCRGLKSMWSLAKNASNVIQDYVKPVSSVVSSVVFVQLFFPVTCSR